MSRLAKSRTKVREQTCDVQWENTDPIGGIQSAFGSRHYTMCALFVFCRVTASRYLTQCSASDNWGFEKPSEKRERCVHIFPTALSANCKELLHQSDASLHGDHHEFTNNWIEIARVWFQHCLHKGNRLRTTNPLGLWRCNQYLRQGHCISSRENSWPTLRWIGWLIENYSSVWYSLVPSTQYFDRNVKRVVGIVSRLIHLYLKAATRYIGLPPFLFRKSFS